MRDRLRQGGTDARDPRERRRTRSTSSPPERPGEDPNKSLIDYVGRGGAGEGKVYSRGRALGDPGRLRRAGSQGRRQVTESQGREGAEHDNRCVHITSRLCFSVVGIAAFALSGAGRAGVQRSSARQTTTPAKEATPATGSATPTGHEGHHDAATPAPRESPSEKGVDDDHHGRGDGSRLLPRGRGRNRSARGTSSAPIDCARSGQTLAIYDRANDRIYFIAGELPGKNPNDPLMQLHPQEGRRHGRGLPPIRAPTAS